jgi:hypothetical protein
LYWFFNCRESRDESRDVIWRKVEPEEQTFVLEIIGTGLSLSTSWLLVVRRPDILSFAFLCLAIAPCFVWWRHRSGWALTVTHEPASGLGVGYIASYDDEAREGWDPLLLYGIRFLGLTDHEGV